MGIRNDRTATFRLKISCSQNLDLQYNNRTPHLTTGNYFLLFLKTHTGSPIMWTSCWTSWSEEVSSTSSTSWLTSTSSSTWLWLPSGVKCVWKKRPDPKPWSPRTNWTKVVTTTKITKTKKSLSRSLINLNHLNGSQACFMQCVMRGGTDQMFWMVCFYYVGIQASCVSRYYKRGKTKKAYLLLLLMTQMTKQDLSKVISLEWRYVWSTTNACNTAQEHRWNLTPITCVLFSWVSRQKVLWISFI